MSTTPAASPTGLPFLPQVAWKIVTVVVGLSWVITEFDILPDHTILDQVFHKVVGIGIMLGLASPGLRKQA